MHNEPDLEERLLRFASGDEDPELSRHLASCGDCREQLQLVQRLVSLREVAGGTLREPPVLVVQQTNALFTRIRPDLVQRDSVSSTPISARLKQIWAQLVLDTGATPEIAGLRSASDRRTQQFAFTSDVADLDLEVTRDGDVCSVVGQLGMDTVPSGLTIRFVPADNRPIEDALPDSHQAVILESGHFALLLPPAEWIAVVEIDNALIVFSGVQL